MKRKTLCAVSLLATISYGGHAQVVYGNDEQKHVKSMYYAPISHVSNPEDGSPQITSFPRYKLSGITDNWFVSLQGGFVSFVGDPVSHTDFNGRTKVGLDLSVGKWHSPYFGTRLTYQGFKFVDSQRTGQSFSSYHADALFNVSSLFRPSFDQPAKWNISPYVGIGFLRHHRLKRSHFAFSYGITGSYSLSGCIRLSASFGGTTTHRDFDGYGESGRFGDNLISGSVGLSVGIGHLGWHAKHHEQDKAYGKVVRYPTATDFGTYPRNNYSGLKSLQERIAGGDTAAPSTGNVEDATKFDAPILFFFKRNTTNLVDRQQLVNIKEIADAVKEYDLDVHIVGAADSRTGTAKRNRNLSINRCRYIAKLLFKAGVPKSKMTGGIRGGINYYKPYTANRHTCVILSKKKQ